MPAQAAVTGREMLRGGLVTSRAGQRGPGYDEGVLKSLHLPEAPLRDQSCMPLPADAEAVIAGAEEIVRRAAGREEARCRRRDRNERKRHRRREEQDREAAQRRERERAEDERLRAEADGRGGHCCGGPWRWRRRAAGACGTASRPSRTRGSGAGDGIPCLSLIHISEPT